MKWLRFVFPPSAAPMIGADDTVAPEQILFSWTKAKGAVALTMSSKKDRLEGYLHAGDLELSRSEEEIKTLDEAGSRGALHFQMREIARRLAWVTVLCVFALGMSFLSGVELF